MQLNVIVDSYIQINTKENNLYIKSDTVNIYDNEIVSKNNIINSNFGSGKNNTMIYNKITRDLTMQERPSFVVY
jgi:hypothetical protein